jgi:pyruvate/2-oxoacid:ferredoxin oxidoreductase beta subunit
VNAPTLCIPACCGIVTAGAFPTSAYGVPTVATTFASSAAVATGVSNVYAMNNEPDLTMSWCGDGGTYDIGMATISAAAERQRGHPLLLLRQRDLRQHRRAAVECHAAGCEDQHDREGQAGAKKDIMAIMAGHRIPYAATLSVAHRDDFMAKIRKARKMKGFRFLLMLSPCPTGWKSEPGESVDLIDKAVRSGLFPLYEVFDGRRYRISARPDGTPLEDYLSRQRRYKSETLDLDGLRAQIADNWAYLEAMEKAFPARDDD